MAGLWVEELGGEVGRRLGQTVAGMKEGPTSLKKTLS